jgi:hypothetical protein
VTGYGPDSWDSISNRDKRFFSSPQHLDHLCGPSNLLHNGYWGLFPGGRGEEVKWSGCEADHSPLPIAKFNNSGAIPPLSHEVHGVVLN